MEHFFSEGLVMRNVNKLRELGLQQDDIIKLTGINLSEVRAPQLTKKYAYNVGLSTYRAFKDLGYQNGNELKDELSTMDKSGFHKAFIYNSLCLPDAINKLFNISSNNSTGNHFDISADSSRNRVFIRHQFPDERDDYYSPHAIFGNLAQIIQEFCAVDMNELDIEIGVKGNGIPNESLFTKIISEKIRTKEDSSYISFNSKFWAMNNKRYNSALDSYFLEQYKIYYQAQVKGVENDVLSRVKEQLDSIQKNGYSSCNIDAVAKKLNMSRTTLYRHLAERQANFKSLVEETRKKHAISYIQNSSLSLNEISDMLGYSNLSAFTRAFRRWYNATPSSYR